MIPRLDAAKIRNNDAASMDALAQAARGVGFATVYNTALTPARVHQVLEAYRAFFHRPESTKRAIDMARTGANRGWGAPGSEQVAADANPDYKQFFDSGFELSPEDPLAKLSVYAPNQWPQGDDVFRQTVQSYYVDACGVAMDVLRGLAACLGRPRDAFDAAFDKPMALLRGNFYPERPAWATAKDFGIATHTDYGCLTLLATDGSPGLEVRQRGGGWIAVEAAPGDFVINFGEMMEVWTGGEVKATPHRVVGGVHERVSVPLFFNPAYDTDVAPPGAPNPVLAGEHLTRRFEETYVHLKNRP